MMHTATDVLGRGPKTRTTYAPPIRPDALPVTAAEWRRRAGLADPSALAAVVRLRAAGSGSGSEPSYADFFEATR